MATKRLTRYDWTEMKDGYYLTLPLNASHPLITIHLREVKTSGGGTKWNARINDVLVPWDEAPPTTVEKAAILVMDQVAKQAQKITADLGMHLLDAEKTLQIVSETCTSADHVFHEWLDTARKCKHCDERMDSPLIIRIGKRLRELAFGGQ